MKLIEIKDNQKSDYNRFVMNCETGSFLQSWEWGKWQEKIGREVYRFFCEDGDKVVASLQLEQRPLPMGQYYLYCPYGPVVDLGFKIEDLRIILEQLRQKFPKAIFIRIEPKNLSNLQLTTHNSPIIKSANIQPAKTLIVDLTRPEEQVLSEMHHKTRYNIRLAQKHGVKIQDEFCISIGNGLFFKEAVDLILQTAQRQSFNTYPAKYYDGLINALALNNRNGDLRLHVYKAVYKNQLLSAAIMLDFGKTRTFLFGGSSMEHKNVMAPYLLHFQAMADAKKQGMEQYDFWGIETSSGETPGFVRFKLGFGGKAVEYPGAYDIVQNKFVYELYKVFRKIHRLANRAK